MKRQAAKPATAVPKYLPRALLWQAKRQGHASAHRACAWEGEGYEGMWPGQSGRGSVMAAAVGVAVPVVGWWGPVNLAGVVAENRRNVWINKMFK